MSEWINERTGETYKIDGAEIQYLMDDKRLKEMLQEVVDQETEKRICLKNW